MKTYVSILVLISILLFSCTKANQKEINIKGGVIDLVNYNFKKDGTVKIQGEVNYFPSQLLTVDQIHSGDYNPVLVKFPGKLSTQLPNADAKGYGTYHFKIRLPKDDNSYGMFIQGIYSSYKLYIADQLEDKLGKVGTTAQSQVPMVRPEIVNLYLDEGFNDVILQVSNFHENQTQIAFALEIGDIHAIYQRRYVTYGYDFSFSFLYLILFGSFIFMYLLHKKTNYLIFSIYCFVLAYRFLIKNSKFLLEITDSNWEFFYKSEDVTYYITSTLIPIILCGMFKVPKKNSVIVSLASISLVVSLITFLTPISIFSPYVFIYHYYSIGLVLFSLVITIFFHLLKLGPKHGLLVAGVITYATCFLYDVIMSLMYYQESYYYNWGLTVLSLIIAIVFVRIQFFNENKLNYKSLWRMKK